LKPFVIIALVRPFLGFVCREARSPFCSAEIDLVKWCDRTLRIRDGTQSGR